MQNPAPSLSERPPSTPPPRFASPQSEIRSSPQKDIPIPLIILPPEQSEIKSYSILWRHLKQSDFIFDAFQTTFGTTDL